MNTNNILKVSVVSVNMNLKVKVCVGRMCILESIVGEGKKPLVLSLKHNYKNICIYLKNIKYFRVK